MNNENEKPLALTHLYRAESSLLSNTAQFGQFYEDILLTEMAGQQQLSQTIV